VKKAGTITEFVAMYSNLRADHQFSLNNKPAATASFRFDTPKQFPCPELPDWLSGHIWNKPDVEKSLFPQAGRQLPDPALTGRVTPCVF